MPSESDSLAGAPLGASGSGEPPSSRLSEAEPSLIEALHGLVHQLGETNVHLLVMADQTAKCLAHISILLDMLVSSEVAEEEEEQPTTYLDGSSVT